MALPNTVRNVAGNLAQWKKWAGGDGSDFDQDIEAKIRFLVELWPDEIRKDDDEGNRLRRRMQAGQAARAALNQPAAEPAGKKKKKK